MPEPASQPGGPSFSLFKMIDDLKRSSSERDQGRAEGMEKVLRDMQILQHEDKLNKAMQREQPSRTAQSGASDQVDLALLQRLQQSAPGGPPPQPGLSPPGGGGGLPPGVGGGLPPGGPGLPPGGPGGIPPQLAALLQLSQGIG